MTFDDPTIRSVLRECVLYLASSVDPRSDVLVREMRDALDSGDDADRAEVLRRARAHIAKRHRKPAALWRKIEEVTK